MSERRALQVSMEELLPVMEEVWASGNTFRIPVTGMSMYPTLRHGRDQLMLSRPRGPLKKHDLPLYRRDNGQFILHRVVAVQPDGCYTCCGDHQWVREKDVRPDQIVALVTEICRKGRTFSTDHLGYRLWVRLWDAVLPIRKPIFKVLRLISRGKRRLLPKA